MENDMDYKDFVLAFHKTMVDHKIKLAYEGEINQTITKAFSAMAEKNMSDEQESATTVRRVYHVMVECLQNICKHAEDAEFDNGLMSGNGILVVGQGENEYTITSGNNISNDKIQGLSDMLTQLNEMEPQEVKEYYKQTIKSSKLSEKGGAGLGFIDILKKTGNKFKFHFEPVDNETSFFILVSKINKQ